MIHTETVRINVRSSVNASKIRREKRNGRDKIIVPSATLPDDVIMNGIKYPAAEIAKAYKTLENKPAPLGHPTINGEFVSASDPEGINLGWIGAHNENVRQEKGRVLLDKVIDVARANESEGGRRVLAAIEKGDVIHTSNALFCNLEDPDGDDHESIAVNMFFDHDAILLDEDGAATPKQGVGIFVNSKGKSEKVDVLNMEIEEEIDDQIKWSAHSLASAIDKKSRLSAVGEITQAIFKAIGYKGAATATNDVPKKETEQMADKEQLDALNNQMAEIKTAVEGMGSTLAETLSNAITGAMATALKPMVDAQNAAQTAKEAAETAELAGYVETIVKSNMLSKEAADALPMAAAKEMAANAKTPKAAKLNGAFNANSDDDDFGDYDPNVNIDAAMKGA
jgi:hypothetical protein